MGRSRGLLDRWPDFGLLDHVVGGLGHFEVLHVFAVDELLPSEIECLLSDPLELGIALDDVPESRLEALADLQRIFALELAEVLDEPDDLIENLSPVLLHIPHKLLYFFVLGTVDHKLVAILHIGIELLGEVGMREEGMADLDIAVILVLSLLIFPEELGDVLVGLQVLIFKFF